MNIDCNICLRIWALCYGGISGAIGSLLLTTQAIAQPPIAADQTLAQPSVVDYEPDLNRHRITQGTAQGENLFHSFERFNIPAGSEAIFYFNRFEIANIFARVTGSSLSVIEGLLGIDVDFSSEMGSPPTNDYVQVSGERALDRTRSGAYSAGVNLFLINPNGIVFGEHAAIDVGGAFVATTASGIQFGSDSFSAVAPTSPSGLLAIAPSAYFFNQIPQAIVSSSVRSRPDGSNFLGLRAYNGEDITFLGGDITIDGGGVGAGLNAFGGRIELAALSGPGTVDISDGSLLFSENLALGTVQLINNARLDVSLHRDGEIEITARDIDILDRSALLAGISQRLGSSGSQAGDIGLKASGTLRLDQGRIANDVAPSGAGNSGNIILHTGRLQITNGGQISASSFGSGDSGNVLVTAADQVTLQGLGQSPARSSAIFTRVESGAIGSGGDVVITARSLNLFDGGQISASTLGTGDSGDILINAQESVTLASQATNGAFNGDIFTSVGLNPEEVAQDGKDPSRDRPVGNGGDITITTGRLRVADGASLTAATFGNGNAGNIAVTTTGNVVFEGTSADGRFASQASTQVGAGASGSGGNIQIRAGGLVEIRGNAVGPQPGLLANTAGTGNAGNILVTADQIKLNYAQISTASADTAGGAIALSANQIWLRGDSDIQTNVAIGAGSGGDITLSGQQVFAFDDSDILASARDGRGGNIALRVGGYFGAGFVADSLGANPGTLEGNDRPDINATGAVSGMVTIPDISFIENSLANLPEAAVPFEQILAGSCIARARPGQDTFVITGSGGLPTQPGDRFLSAYPTGDVQRLPDAAPYAHWQPGQTIEEPTGVFELADGRLVLSRECHG